MIGWMFLSLGGVGTAVVAYAVAPAARGAHRYVVPRSVLRAQTARSTEAAEDLACKLVGLSSELDGAYEELRTVHGRLDDANAALEKAGLRIADLEEQVRGMDRLSDQVTALKARLANATAITPLPPHRDTAAPLTRVVPLDQAPFALKPVAKPN